LTFRKLESLLEKEASFLITSHIDPDGDSIGSELALADYLEQKGKQVVVANADPVPPRYTFLPRSERIGSQDPGDGLGAVFVLDSAELERLGAARDWIRPGATVVNVDHHVGNDGFGDQVFVNPQASSTAELIFHLVEEMGGPLTPAGATCLYTGIMMDTVRFRTPQTSPAVFTVCARLVEAGADPGRITDAVYDQRNPETLALLGEVLRTLNLSPDGRIATILLSQEMCRRTGGALKDGEGFVNEVMSLRGVQVGIILRELEDGKVRVSLRSRNPFDVHRVAGRFGGGGHPQAAGCVLELPLEDARKTILREVLTSP